MQPLAARALCLACRASALLFVLLLVIAAARAQAQASREPAEYRRAIERGLEEYQLGNFQEARDQFSRAHALYPSARTLRGLGFTAFELRNYVESVTQLESALGSQVKPLDGALRRETEEMLSRARGYVGEVAVAVEPVSASVVVDGIKTELGAKPLRLDVGDHILEFRAAGWLPERRPVRVQGGKLETLKIALSRLVPEAPQVADSRQEHVETLPVYKRWWLWTTIGVVVAAGAATGVALALTAEHRKEYQGVPGDGTPKGLGIQALRGSE